VGGIAASSRMRCHSVRQAIVRHALHARLIGRSAGTLHLERWGRRATAISGGPKPGSFILPGASTASYSSYEACAKREFTLSRFPNLKNKMAICTDQHV
jgi:hypothetical protein